MDPHAAASVRTTNAASPGRMDAAFNGLSIENRTVLSRLFPSNPHNSPSSSPDANGAKLRVETRSLHVAALAPGPSARDRSATTWPDRVVYNTNNNAVSSNHHQNDLSVTPMRPSGFFLYQSEPKSAPSVHARSMIMQQSVNQQHSDPKNENDVVVLREQVALLRKSLEEEKKRRILEQKLMQEKIIELQGLIRSDFPEHKKAQERRLVQMRSPSAARSKFRSAGSGSKLVLKPQLLQKSSKSNSSSSGSSAGSSVDLASSSSSSSVANDEAAGTNNQHSHNNSQQLPSEDEAASSSRKLDKEATELRMKKQLTKLRARMQTMVTDAQTEAKTLRTLLTNEQLRFERKERHWRVETNAKFAALEEKHAVAKKKLTAKTALLSSHAAHLMAENQILAAQLQEKDARITHLELALGGKRIIMETHSASNATTKQP